MTLRRAILKIHLYVALVAAPVLLCAALSGAVLALAPELEVGSAPASLAPGPAAARWSEQALVNVVARTRAGGDAAAIERIQLHGAREAQVFVMRSGERVFVDPNRGVILGTRVGPTAMERSLSGLFQLHVRLLSGNAGQWIVDLSTTTLLLLIPSGVVLWWNKKRFVMRRGANWRQFNWDLHSVVGIWAGVFVLVLSLSGILLAWEQPLYWMANARPEREQALPHSAPLAERISPAGIDAWLGAADRALPAERTFEVLMPMTARSAVQISKRAYDGAGPSTVYLDRYDARVLRADAFDRAPRAYFAHVVNRAIHTGEIRGLPTRALMSLASLALAVMVVTGTILWLKRIVR
jgi:uncharacterized iron-regulated membrane protein